MGDTRDAVFGQDGHSDPALKPRVDAAHSLLFGLLALHNNFIDRETLLAAFNTWVADKSRSLGTILLDKGALTPARHTVLQSLVLEHLQQHDFDPQRSLTAITVPPSVRDGLEEIPDFVFQNSLIEFCLAESGAEHTDGESTADRVEEGAATEAVGRFRIVRFHDRGALGEVYVARDLQLHRVVALKRIKRDHADDKDKMARFVVEAEITGRLEHPGIVPVYGLGTYDDGRPFYAMRFIRGDNLKSAIEQFHQAEEKGRSPGERSLALLKLLRRFLDVCNAVDYAHSRGVLHRDIKPGNIMLGKYGETLVVDWGMAKSAGRPDPAASATMDERTLIPHSGSDLHGTEVGARLGTPAYMSPEQAAGRIDAIGPASDVYSLGATLYCLLTGRAPFGGQDVAELFRKVERGDFTPPRQIKSWIDPALEAVCKKAMATDPGARYRTPRALADDVEHWLADESITAWREPWTRSLLRGLKRHRTAVVGVGAAMMAALVGLAVVSAVQTRANGLLTRANEALLTANTQLSNAKDEITRTNEQLRASRDREHERFNLAMNAINVFHGDVSRDLLLKEKEFEKLRTKLLRGAAGFYNQLGGLLEKQSDPESRQALARAYDELGELTDKIGAKTEALAVRVKGIALRRELAARPGAGPGASLELARGLIATADLKTRTGDQAGALAELEEARGLVEGPVAPGPAGDASRAALGLALRQSANLLWYQGKQDDARARLERARVIFESLAQANPAVIRYQTESAECYMTLGEWLGGSDFLHPRESLAAKERILAIRQQLADTHPEDTDLQASLALALRSTAFELSISGRSGEALTLLERSRVAWKRLIDANPAVTTFKSQEARVLKNMGIALSLCGKFAHAVSVGREALSAYQKLIVAHPDEVDLRVSLGYTYSNLGCTLVHLGELAEALAALERGEEVFQSLADAHPDVIRYRNDQIFRQRDKSRVLRKLGRPAEALDLGRRLLHTAERLAEPNPEPSLLPSVLSELALDFKALGDTAAAVSAARRAVSIADKQSRDSAENCRTSAICHAVLWTVCGGLGTGISEAERELEAQTAIALWRRNFELGDRDRSFYDFDLPEPFIQRTDFRLLLLDLAMPNDPFAGP